jgi:hypothetical protein
MDTYNNTRAGSINQVRYGCALGALHSVVAIPEQYQLRTADRAALISNI